MESLVKSSVTILFLRFSHRTGVGAFPFTFHLPSAVRPRHRGECRAEQNVGEKEKYEGGISLSHSLHYSRATSVNRFESEPPPPPVRLLKETAALGERLLPFLQGQIMSLTGIYCPIERNIAT